MKPTIGSLKQQKQQQQKKISIIIIIQTTASPPPTTTTAAEEEEQLQHLKKLNMSSLKYCIFNTITLPLANTKLVIISRTNHQLLKNDK